MRVGAKLAFQRGQHHELLHSFVQRGPNKMFSVQKARAPAPVRLISARFGIGIPAGSSTLFAGQKSVTI